MRIAIGFIVGAIFAFAVLTHPVETRKWMHKSVDWLLDAAQPAVSSAQDTIKKRNK